MTMYIQQLLHELTWRCEVCDKVRDDKDISVLTYPLVSTVLIDGQRNLKYCNDDPECYRKAVEKSKTGKI